MESEMHQAIEYAERSLVISRELGMHEQTALTLNDLSRPYISLGQFDRARAAMEEALVFFRETGNQPMLSDCLSRFAAMNLATGRFDQMLEAALSAQKISEAIGNLWGQSFSRLFVGPVYFARGEISRAETAMRDCIRLGEQTGFMMPSVSVRVELAFFYGALGKVRQGIELAEQAHAFTLEHLPNFECKACATLARLHTMNGDLVQAETNLKKAAVTLKEDFAQQVVDQLAVAEMEIALARKDYAHAVKTADDSLERFRKLGFFTFHGEVHLHQAQALRGLGDEQSARQVFIQAKTEAAQIGSRWLLWQIHAALGERAQACEHIEFIAAHAPPELHESFLAKPEVRAEMKV
jgi:tetratricopeptide (TPR) repeat protein